MGLLDGNCLTAMEWMEREGRFFSLAFSAAHEAHKLLRLII